MPSIRQSVQQLSAQVKKIAKASGEPRILATQEVTAAFKAGKITKAQRDLLTRALSDGQNTVAAVKKTLKTYVQAFERADVNKNGRSEKSERAKHQAAVDNWSMIAARPNRTQAEKDAARKPVISVDAVGQSGKVYQQPVWAISSLLEKLEKLMPTATPAERYAGFTNDAIKAAVKDGRVSKADAQKIVSSYFWTQHGEFTDLLADKAVKFEAGARAVITKFLAGPLPE